MRLGQALLLLYPKRWRERYGDELRDLLEDLQREGDRSRTRIIASLIVGAAEARLAALRAATLRGVAVVTAIAATFAAIMLLAVSTTGHAGGSVSPLQAALLPSPTVTSGSQASSGDPSPRLKQHLLAEMSTMCARLTSGQRATVVAMNPDTGAIVAKIVRICGEPA